MSRVINSQSKNKNKGKIVVATPHVPAQSLHDTRAYAMCKLSKHTTPATSKEIERSIMNYTKKSCELQNISIVRWSDVRVRRMYIRKLRMILNNIDSLLNENDLSRCAFMTHQELRPDIYNPLLDVIDKRSKFSILNYADEGHEEGLLACGNCGSKRTISVTLQKSQEVYLKCFACGTNDTHEN
jgi:hypothetical protein